MQLQTAPTVAGKKWTNEDLDLMEKAWVYRSRKSFWSYRQYMNPRLISGWWQREVAIELHRFWLEYQAGLRPKLLLQSPPQHGKSSMVVDFISWLIGQDRNIKIIFASFSDRLGIRANLRLQRVFNNPKHAAIFGPVFPAGGIRNSQLIEFTGYDGYFRNTTVHGAVTGEGLDIGIIDDPIKGRAEASSQLTRDTTWSWMTDDFLPRFADNGGMIMIMTRWHLDDPAGRLVENHPGVRVCRYSAIAERDEEHRDLKNKPFIRKEGEPLFPELKSLEFLQQQRGVMSLAGWQSVYQQAPILTGNNMFPMHKVEHVAAPPSPSDIIYAARYWDKAGTADAGAFSAGVLMLRMRDNTYVVADVRRGRWGALDRERMIRQTAEIDREKYPTVKIWVEQEPGSGGKESAEATVRMLAGFVVEADRVSGAKEVRAWPFAAQWQAGNIRLVAAPWNRDYLDEHEHFPAGKFKDQVDASSGAFNKIASKYRYDSTLSWVS